MKFLTKLITTFYVYGFLVASVAAAAPSSSMSTVELDEINLIGVTVFNLKDLEKVVEVSAGDRLDRGKIVQTARNIQDLYKGAGYESVKVETRLSKRTMKSGHEAENILEIVISEGKPSRIAEIGVEYDLPGWSERLSSASDKIGLRSGDIYDREKLLNGFRAMQDGLTSWDFLSPKVDESVVDQVAAPDTPEAKALLQTTARWVRVRIKVQLGDRVSFSYRDNTVFPNSQLSSWIEEQRLLGFSQDYIERIRGRFEDEYRKLGYDRVKVEVFTFEDHENLRRKVTYAISEGPRVEIERIEFDGNTVFPQSILRDRFGDRASPSVSRGYYVAKDVEQSAELLIEWMKSQGYLAAKLVSISKNYRPNGSHVDLIIYVYEGEQTIVDTVVFQGLTVFKPEELTALLDNGASRPLNLYSLNEGLEKIKAKYRERGYLDIKIANEGTNRLVRYSQENRLADVTLELQEGVQYHVSHIEIEGLQKTQPEVVTRELEIHEGDILSERTWFRSEAKLRRLGLFANASIKAFPDPDSKNGKILKVLVEEGTPGLVAGGIGFRNDLGVRAFGQIQYSNILGKNHTIALTANANRRYKWLGDSSFCPSTSQFAEDPNADWCYIEFTTTLGYVWPWFALGETTFRPRFSYDRTQFKTFDADTATLQASWDRYLVRDWGLTGVFTYSLEEIIQQNANTGTDNQRLRIGSISPTVILDRRDNALAPTKGTYSTLQFDLAESYFGSQNSPPYDAPISYYRTQFRHDFYVPLPKSIDLYLSFRTGYERNLATPSSDPNNPPAPSTYSIPLIKQFTLGGVGSLRGFGEQSLNAQNTDIRGTLTYVNYRTQIDLPFAGAMKFGPFVDAANLNIDHYTLGALRWGVGAGFHYKSPVGPVNFDIGFNPWPDRFHPEEDSYRLHFSIGNI
jgi:outer membrane protein insertion porin family